MRQKDRNFNDYLTGDWNNAGRLLETIYDCFLFDFPPLLKQSQVAQLPITELSGSHIRQTIRLSRVVGNIFLKEYYQYVKNSPRIGWYEVHYDTTLKTGRHHDRVKHQGYIYVTSDFHRREILLQIFLDHESSVIKCKHIRSFSCVAAYMPCPTLL